MNSGFDIGAETGQRNGAALSNQVVSECRTSAVALRPTVARPTVARPTVARSTVARPTVARPTGAPEVRHGLIDERFTSGQSVCITSTITLFNLRSGLGTMPMTFGSPAIPRAMAIIRKGSRSPKGGCEGAPINPANDHDC